MIAIIDVIQEIFELAVLFAPEYDETLVVEKWFETKRARFFQFTSGKCDKFISRRFRNCTLSYSIATKRINFNRQEGNLVVEYLCEKVK